MATTEHWKKEEEESSRQTFGPQLNRIWCVVMTLGFVLEFVWVFSLVLQSANRIRDFRINAQLSCIPSAILVSTHKTKTTFTQFDYAGNTVEPRYNEVLGTMKITLLYQVSHIRAKKQRNIKSRDQQNYLVIRGFCYIRPLYNEVPLYIHWGYPFFIDHTVFEPQAK